MFRQPKASCCLSYIDYRPNTKQQYYAKQVTLRGGHKRKVTRVKEGSKVNMADVLPIQE
jgi:hypothetical protein